MLAKAERRRRRQGAKVELRQLDVTRTDFPDRHFDHVVATFLFCVLEDELQLPALAELRRVLKPDGEIRLLEYTYSENPLRRLVMRFWAPWVRLLYGATFDRRTERYVDDAGLVLVEDRFVVHDIIKLLVLRQPRKEAPMEET
jgi:ubiquinone/menaquinone biosynthesis C-methylase UbiE